MGHSLYALLNRKYGRTIDGATRREFLKATLAASAGLLISRSIAMGDTPRPKRNGLRVAVIGAGFSGLACAYELMSAGYDVTVIEARDRVGGRVLSFGDFIDKRNVEGGGELIGSNHPTWVAYQQHFGLEFLDVTEDKDAEAPIMLGGKRLSKEESDGLWDDISKASNLLNDVSAKVDIDQPWKTPDAALLDKKTTKAWIDSLDVSALCKAGLVAQFEANNGQAIEKQSFLGNLAQIAGGGGEKYWTESEVYRCKGGNQSLAFELAKKIGDRLILGLPVSSVNGRGDKMIVTCADDRTIECDDVVLAVPPTVWKRISFTPGLPEALMPQMGMNVKYLAHVKRRFWKDKKLSPDSLTDSLVNMTWDGTDAQEGDDNVELTGFSGGPAAEKALAIAKDQRDAEYGKMLELLYPGFGENFVKSRFMDWPNEKFTGGGYSFPAPGQVTTVGPLLYKGAGRLHFVGEHTCYKFVGYMEGGLNSGVSLAKRLADRDGVAMTIRKATSAPTSEPAEKASATAEKAPPAAEKAPPAIEKTSTAPALVK
jgi:monoamine oxidase